ncbi:hypothetical protein AB1N83_009991 [Pleurotus pulmonarius]
MFPKKSSMDVYTGSCSSLLRVCHSIDARSLRVKPSKVRRSSAIAGIPRKHLTPSSTSVARNVPATWGAPTWKGEGRKEEGDGSFQALKSPADHAPIATITTTGNTANPSAH